MNLNLLKRNFKDKRISLAVYACGIALYAVLILAIWPSLRQNMEALNQLWESYPESIRKAFGSENMQFATFDGFISVEYFSQMWPLIMIAFSISYATGAIAAEIEKGTIELLLGQPLSRRSIVVTRHFFFEICILLLIMASILPIALGAPVVGGDVSQLGLFSLIVPSFLFFTAIGSMTFFFSVLFSSRGRAIFVSVGIVIFCYALDILAKINDTVGNVHFLSLFYYWDPYRFIHGPRWAWGDLAVLAAVSVLSTAAAVVWFERRDIAV